MSTMDSSMIPSSQRPIPFMIRPDLVVQRVEYRGVVSWVVKDPVGLKYHRLDPEQYRCLQLLDGHSNLEQLNEKLAEEFPTLHLQLTDVQGLVTELHRKGVVFSNRPGQGPAFLEQQREETKKKRLNLFKNILYLRLPGWDPQTTLDFLYPFFRWTSHPLALFMLACFVVSSWVLVFVNFREFESRLPEFQQFFGWPNLIYLWITMALVKVLHEFGHGMTCKHYGGECHEMGVMLLVFSPTLYCDVTDSWMMPNKWHRIIIGAGGMIVEVVLSAAMIYVWWFTEPGLLHHLALNLFFITTITTVIFNANPLMRFDGYYMMSDWLEIPNLRPKADKTLREKFAWYCLGIEPKPDRTMPTSGKLWFILFAISAWIYRWVVVFGITLFLYTVLKPYELQSIGVTMAVVSVASIIWGLGSNFYKIIMAPRIEPISYFRTATSITVLCLLIAGAMCIPFPWHLEAPVLLEPDQIQHVYTETPGELKEVLVKPGDIVAEGDSLAILYNHEKQLELEKTKLQLETENLRLITYQAQNSTPLEKQARTKIKNLESQISELSRQLEKLTLKAPISGRVISPPSIPEPKHDPTTNKLHSWYGTPLQKQNLGAMLDTKTHFLSIAPNEFFVAKLVVKQDHRNDLHLEDTIELKFEHLPDKTYEATVTEISDRELVLAPESLSNKVGGPLPTISDSQGNERLVDTSYMAQVKLEEDVDLFRTALRGNARFLVEKNTAWQWLWKYIRSTFHFRL